MLRRAVPTIGHTSTPIIEVAIYGLDPIDLIAGSLPQRQRRLVEAWVELHQDELRANWERLQEGRGPRKIEPLR